MQGPDSALAILTSESKKHIGKLQELLDIERLAALEHDQWAFLIKHLLEVEPTISQERREKWLKLAATPYEELSEEEKEKDRVWARKVTGTDVRATQGLKKYKSPSLVVDIIVARRRSILLVKRGKPPFEGCWALPGGFVEVGETVEQAALRELEEETAIKGIGARQIAVYSDPARDPRGHVVSVALWATEPIEEVAPKGGDDAAVAAFHDLDALPPLAFDHALIIKQWRSRWYQGW